jgi:hypothetical protein
MFRLQVTPATGLAATKQNVWNPCASLSWHTKPGRIGLHQGGDQKPNKLLLILIFIRVSKYLLTNCFIFCRIKTSQKQPLNLESCHPLNKSEALQALKKADLNKLYAFSKQDLWKMFPNEDAKTFEKSLQRLVVDGILERPSKGVYLNALAHSKGATVIEDIASLLRRGDFSYISLESALSEYGVISQAPVSHLTVMTTGAAGTYVTPYGTIEFTRTKRRPLEVIERSTTAPTHNLRMATKNAAIQDLRRVGRNVNMLDAAEI